VLTQDLTAEYEKLLHELEAYEADLLDKPRMVALSKIDLLAPDEQALLPDIVADDFPDDVPLLPISAVAQKGLDRLKQTLLDAVQREKAKQEGQDAVTATTSASGTS
jgi:GTP-binding protein